MSIIRKGQESFKPRARLLVLLGEQLITDEVIAVVELVKNSYDADARSVTVTLESVSDRNKGRIIIEDDGSGMSLDTILNVWLEPATDFRQKQRESRERTSSLKRLPLGEKGVGRFAAHKLGEAINLVTKAEQSKEEVVVAIDWKEFEKVKYLKDIPVAWALRAPEVFMGKAHGTKITIERLRKPWTEKMVRDLYTRMQALNSPFAKKTDFRVTVAAREYAEMLEDLPGLSDILGRAVYLMKGRVDADGILHYMYTFNNPAFPTLARQVTDQVEDVRDPRVFRDGRKPLCGPFSIMFYVWDLDPATLAETIERTYYNHYVKPHTGIRIYRDAFRVWPYGEPDDDSFGLDARRVNNPSKCLSRNQVIGIVEVGYSDNPQLRDKTDREGLILNQEYEDFRELVIACISEFEAERRKDKDKIDTLRERRKPSDEMHRAIDELQTKMDKKGHLPVYKDDLKKLRTTYDSRVREILDPLLVSAGIGIAYMLPVHEITRNIKDMERLLNLALDDIKKAGVKKSFVESLSTVLQTTDLVDELVRGVGKLSRKGRPEVISLRSVVKDSLDIMISRLGKDNIEVVCQDAEDVRVKGMRGMLVTAVLNLLDNSSYWLLRRESGRKILVRTDRDADGKARLIVSDNGPGIRDDPALLVQPFFTRKPDGFGLGLYIVDRIMKTHHGELRFLNKKDGKWLLAGASVALVFAEEKDGGR